MGNLPLEGVRVVTMTVVWAGPFAEMFLADWGAEVIKVETIQRFTTQSRGRMARPPEVLAKSSPTTACYPNDQAGDRPWNRCSIFNYHARNKLGCTMDLTQPSGKELFKRLIARSDVFLENNAGGVVNKLGIGFEALREVNPRLIMISLPAFGNYGPYKYFHGFANHQEAISGHTLLRGYLDLGPTMTPNAYHADACAGAKSALAVMLALRQRRRTGKGQFIDFSQAEAALSHQAEAIMDYSMNRRIRTSLGNRHASAAPCGTYRTKGEDEWVAITVYGDRDWEGFCRALGNPEWTQDERFSSSLRRWQNQDDLDGFVEQWTRPRTNYEVMHVLQREGVAAGPVLSNKAAFDDPHLLERGQFEEVHQQDCGTYLTPSFLWRARNTPNKIRKPPVRLGEHNEYVYKELIGVSDEEYVQLEKDGHIGVDYAPHVK